MKTTQPLILLFLDFDGVLHSKFSSPDKFFSRLKYFEETISPYPNASIVISSNWRYQNTMDELLAFFSVDFQRRIIGCTRDVSESKATNRYGEILDYLKHTNQMQTLWIAIDDAVPEFPENLKNVVLCIPNIGFDVGAAKRLKQILKMIEG